jgi:hypothetical protein
VHNTIVCLSIYPVKDILVSSSVWWLRIAFRYKFLGGAKLSTQLGKILEVWLLDLMVKLCLALHEIAKLSSTVVVPSGISSSNEWAVLLLVGCIFANIWDYYIFGRCVVPFHFILICHSEHILICSFSIAIAILLKCLFRSFIFLNWVIFFLTDISVAFFFVKWVFSWCNT